jgi:hypothetical protein
MDTILGKLFKGNNRSGESKKTRPFNRLVINISATIGNGKLSSDNKNVKFVARDGHVVVTQTDFGSNDICTTTNNNGTITVDINGATVNTGTKEVNITISGNSVIINGSEVDSPTNTQSTFDLQDYIFDRIVINGDSKLTILDTNNFADHLVDIWSNDTSYTEFMNPKATDYKELVIYSYNTSTVVGHGTQVDTLKIRTHDKSTVSNFKVNKKAILESYDGGYIDVTNGNRFTIIKQLGDNIVIS